MTARVQLSPETRGLLSEAFPKGMERRAPRRRDLSRTARAARELLWSSHREELGYCAAARAYLMEWDQGLFEGLAYSAVRHEDYLARARDYSAPRSKLQFGSEKQSLDAKSLCRLAYSFVPSGSNRLRLANSEGDLELFGSLDDWRSAYSVTCDPGTHVAAAAQNSGLMLIASEDPAGAANAYQLAWSLAGKPGDLVLAALLGGHAIRRCISATDLKRAIRASGESNALRGSVRAVLGRLGPKLVSSITASADSQLRAFLSAVKLKEDGQ